MSQQPRRGIIAGEGLLIRNIQRRAMRDMEAAAQAAAQAEAQARTDEFERGRAEVARLAGLPPQRHYRFYPDDPDVPDVFVLPPPPVFNQQG